MTDTITQGERLDEWLEDFKRGIAAKHEPDERDGGVGHGEEEKP